MESENRRRSLARTLRGRRRARRERAMRAHPAGVRGMRARSLAHPSGIDHVMIEAEILQPWRRRRDTSASELPELCASRVPWLRCAQLVVRPMIEIAAPRLRVRRDTILSLKPANFCDGAQFFSLQPANIFPC